jgi:2,4-dienoyl-CoA reductase-like NADH-dependent reductase (Old Yellow Enzyme family)
LKNKFPESWTVADSCQLAPILAGHGEDFLDVSSGGIHPAQSTSIKSGDGYQVQFAIAIKQAIGDAMPVSAVGGIRTGKMAEGFSKMDWMLLCVVGGFRSRLVLFTATQRN